MEKIKRAIILAAGKGNRLKPVTNDTPKPLVKVNGVRMIDTIISALHKEGITEIYVVAGYMKEKFFSLENEYENLSVIENPYYDECNNVSSLYVARDFLCDAVILDGDQIISNEKILYPVFEKSGYNAIKISGSTNEWLMQADENLNVLSCSRTGGEDGGWQLFSVSRWTEADGKKLKKYLELEFAEKNNRQIYWDDVAMFCHFEDFSLSVFPMQKGDVIEIDTFAELAEIDGSYKNYSAIQNYGKETIYAK